ncbi:hypothetical protein BDV37DRAFT_236687 [Aspergillus pseudonomiae]|uniref:Uncharacterized protein n=1 Tax=Aspergillus pseudonomiae TaxID=1506151 RepID=A0A5N7DTL0_9EURO|nr:uncharacterized protein BDV37DRAFT_236687 [Aspergillus pseudonomiae]KAE8409706.1 hypothetical protein BDV37DRAFT_236687 [Aspergillus pseudonomiae]
MGLPPLARVRTKRTLTMMNRAWQSDDLCRWASLCRDVFRGYGSEGLLGVDHLELDSVTVSRPAEICMQFSISVF